MTIYLLPDVAEKLKAIAKARKTMVGRVIEEMVDGLWLGTPRPQCCTQ